MVLVDHGSLITSQKRHQTGETGESTPDQIFTLEGDTPDDVDPDDDWIDFDEEV